MYAILGEDQADTLSIKCIIKRISGNDRITIKTVNFGGCGELLQKGSRIMKLYNEQGCDKFVIAYDADGPDAAQRQEEARLKIVVASGLQLPSVILIPVQEFEAWILADNAAMSEVITSWRGTEVGNPESQPSPKEYLQILTRGENRKPRYNPANHNPRIAARLDLDIVYKKCPSFRPLREFVLNFPA